MFKVLIDTCVWLDLAKDYQRQAILTALEELVRQKEIELLLPRTILDEFSRNKSRVIEESSRSLSGTLKRVKDVVEKFGDPKKKNIVLEQLNDVDHRLPTLGSFATGTVARIEKLFLTAPVIEISDAVKVRAAQRAIEKRAPFHRQRNGIDDAILIEVYFEAVQAKAGAGNRFAFVTHNTKDFSHPSGNDKHPHPDITACFSKVKSLYFITLGESLRRIQPEQFADLMIEQQWIDEPRRLSEILDAMDELFDMVWYNRHQVLRQKIERGQTKIVEVETFPVKNHLRRPIQRDVWQMARKAAKRVEKRRGKKNLGPWSDFEWVILPQFPGHPDKRDTIAI